MARLFDDAGLLLTGLGLGAGLAYWLDPDRGEQRRQQLRSRTVGTLGRAEHDLERAWRDLGHRAEGSIARARQALREEEVSDDVLVERARAHLGHHVTHPRKIDITAKNGEITLSGTIPPSELAGLLRGIRRVPGVQRVRSTLEVHDDAGVAPRGDDSHRGLIREHWSPGTRLAVASAGTGLFGLGLASRGIGGALLSIFGGAMILGAATRRPSPQQPHPTAPAATTTPKAKAEEILAKTAVMPS